MASFSISTGNTCDFSRHKHDLVRKSSFSYSGHRQQYVPSPALDPTKAPNILNLMNLSKRLYLHHQEVERITHDVESKEAIFTQDLDAKHFLDTGVNPLQRIINEMRALTTKNGPAAYDPNTARKSGLESYADYLTARRQHDIEERDELMRKIKAMSNE